MQTVVLFEAGKNLLFFGIDVYIPIAEHRLLYGWRGADIEIQTILQSVSKAYRAFRDAYAPGKTTDWLLAVFRKSLEQDLGTYEIAYDYIWGKDSVNIDGVSADHIPQPGDTLVMDISVGKDGVWCDVCRTFFVGEPTEGEDGALQIHYTIINPTTADLDVLWAAHCLVNAQPGGQVLTPFAEGHPVDVLYDSTGVISAQTRMPGGDAFLRTPTEAHPPKSAKLYFSGTCPKGFMGYRYPAGDAFMMAFDCKKLPSLGLWVNNRRLGDAYCVGIEPCTVGYDTVTMGKKYGQEKILKAGEKLEFTLTLHTTQA